MANRMVKLTSFRGFAVVNEKEALQIAKVMMRNIKEEGYPISSNWIAIEDYMTGDPLGNLKLTDDETIEGSEMSERILNIRAILR